MRVDEARHCGPPGEINNAGRWVNEPLDLRVGSDGEDAPITDGERLRDVEPAVDGDDLAVAEDKRRFGH